MSVIKEYPACCGAAIFCTFLHMHPSYDKPTIDKITQEIKDTFSALKYYSSDFVVYAITVIGTQSYVDPILTELGFLEIKQTINPNSKNSLRHWIWVKK